jgi:OPA family glycerol-3-phosphate transporter-like MFS transporter
MGRGQGEEARLGRRQAVNLGLMVVGYAGYYLCRSQLSVAMPEIGREVAEARGIGQAEAMVVLGRVVSPGMVAYAVGKLFGGAVADFLGGRFTVLAGMAGSVAFSVLFALGGSVPVFTLAWAGNRFFQSIGWPGMVKIAARWYSFSAYGTVMAILSLSFLFGDAATRALLGALFGWGLGWRGVFFVAAGGLTGVMVLSAWLLRESPADLGLMEPQANPDNLFGEGGERPRPRGAADLVMPLLTSPPFLLVCVLSAGLTLLREVFNTWTPTYFVQDVGLSTSAAATYSAVFPLAGGVSVILVGVLSDRLGRGGRAAIMVVCLALAGAVLATLGGSAMGRAAWLPVGLVGLVAFLLVGPYSYLAGAFALDFGGKRGSATASALIDFFGYLGGFLAGEQVARLVQVSGWEGAFRSLALIAWLSAGVALALLIVQRWRPAAADQVAV